MHKGKGSSQVSMQAACQTAPSGIRHQAAELGYRLSLSGIALKLRCKLGCEAYLDGCCKCWPSHCCTFVLSANTIRESLTDKPGS
jgi:hypothetical protein